MLNKDGLVQQYEKMPGYPLGQYTDDTQMTLAVCESIINKRGIDGEDIAYRFSSLWRANTIIGEGASCRDAMMNIIARGANWDEAGAEEGRAGNGTAMRTSPIGLFDSSDLSALKRDAVTQSIITHKDKRASAGAVAVSAAVYYCVNNKNISPQNFLDFILDAIGGISEEFTAAVSELKEIIALDEEAAFLKIASYCFEGSEQINGITPFVIPTVLAALYHFLKSPSDWTKSVEGALRCGGDTDTTASITGAISGSYNGHKKIPENLVDDLKDNEYIQGIALKLFDVFTHKA
jgi:ADP-ribosylglycohydrolase